MSGNSLLADRRTALRAFGASAVFLAFESGTPAAADARPPVPTGTALDKLTAQLAAAPRRRGFASVPFLVTSLSDWDHEAASLILAYRYKSLQMWENTELGGPWLNLMREAVNGQIFAHGNKDFLAVSATHGTAHLALFSPKMWRKYRLAALTGGKFTTNDFVVEKATASSNDDVQDVNGYYGPGNNNVVTLQKRGVVFVACHDTIHATARNIHGVAEFSDTSPDRIAADLTNNLVQGAVLVPSVVAFMVELQRVGFSYSKGG